MLILVVSLNEKTTGSGYRKIAMASWSYRCYDDGGKPNLWQRWYDDTPAAQGGHDNAFDILEQQISWREPNARHLSEADGLIEVKFKGTDNRQWRVFGFYQSGVRQEFVVVATGYHKMQVYTPRDVIRKAGRIKKKIVAGKEKATPCERPN